MISNGSDRKAVVIKVDEAGQLVTSFGQGGALIQPLNFAGALNNNMARKLFVQTDGKIAILSAGIANVWINLYDANGTFNSTVENITPPSSMIFGQVTAEIYPTSNQIVLGWTASGQQPPYLKAFLCRRLITGGGTCAGNTQQTSADSSTTHWLGASDLRLGIAQESGSFVPIMGFVMYASGGVSRARLLEPDFTMNFSAPPMGTSVVGRLLHASDPDATMAFGTNVFQATNNNRVDSVVLRNANREVDLKRWNLPSTSPVLSSPLPGPLAASEHIREVVIDSQGRTYIFTDNRLFRTTVAGAYDSTIDPNLLGTDFSVIHPQFDGLGRLVLIHYSGGNYSMMRLVSSN